MLGLTFKQQKWLGILFVYLSLKIILYYSNILDIPFLVELPFNFLIYVLVFKQVISEKYLAKQSNILFLFYLIYISFQIIYGSFNAHNYWQYKNLLYNSFSLLLPLFALLFSNPSISIGVLGKWKDMLNPKFVVIFLFFFSIEAIHLSLGPVYFLFGVFVFFLPQKWRFIVGIIIVIMVFGDLGARAQVVKGLLTVVFAIAIYYHKYIPLLLIHFSHWLFYFIALLFLILGLLGVYNIFSPEFFDENKSIKITQIYGDDVKNGNDLTTDSRTFIYLEVISSAINHNYVIFGRSPARGNDTEAFAFAAEELDTNYIERSKNELCHLNIFTWTGIVGLLLYSFFYIYASFLALYRSNNFYVKYLSVLVSFHWAFGWIEDCNNLDMMNVGLWLIIGICMSPQFRSMNEKEFELWFKSIFIKDSLTPFHKWKISNEIIKFKNLPF